MLVLPISLAMGFVAIRDLRVQHRPPAPYEFLAAGGVLLGATLVAQANQDVAVLLAWGYLIAVGVQAATSGRLNVTAPSRGGKK